MKICVNGQQRELPDDATVLDVLDALGSPSSGVAVALDGAVVPRAEWGQARLSDGSVVEVLAAVQGG